MATENARKAAKKIKVDNFIELILLIGLITTSHKYVQIYLSNAIIIENLCPLRKVMINKLVIKLHLFGLLLSHKTNFLQFVALNGINRLKRVSKTLLFRIWDETLKFNSKLQYSHKQL